MKKGKKIATYLYYNACVCQILSFLASHRLLLLGTPDERKARREIANFNERRRMKNINSGFDQLRGLLPVVNDRVSKAAILQHASEYITFLQERTRQQHLEIMQLRSAGANQQPSHPVVTSMADSSHIIAHHHSVQLQSQVGACANVQGMIPISVQAGRVSPMKLDQQHLVHNSIFTMNRIGQQHFSSERHAVSPASLGPSMQPNTSQSWQTHSVKTSPSTSVFSNTPAVVRQGVSQKKKRTPSTVSKASGTRKNAAGKKERRASTPTGFCVKSKPDVKSETTSPISSPQMTSGTSQQPQQNLAVMLAAIATLESTTTASKGTQGAQSTPALAGSMDSCYVSTGAGDSAIVGSKENPRTNPSEHTGPVPRQLISRRLLLSPTQR
eukprot:m.655021 g.655021  ORF g.655021 m.655021 type:complete len:384 (-) comp22694_c0_seq10:2431-3582(-)